MAHIVVAATPFQGHVGPLLAISADLVRRGHQVVFSTGERFVQQVSATGVRYDRLPAACDFDDRHMEAVFPESALVRIGPEMHKFFWHRVFVDAVPAQYRHLLALVRDHGADLIIHDTVFLGALPFAMDTAAGGPKTVGIGVLPPTLLSDDTPPFGPGIPYTPGEAGRARHRALNDETLEIYADLQAHAAAVFESIGFTLPDFVFTSAVTVPDHYLQLTIPGFEYPRPTAPASFRMVGALRQLESPMPHRPDWWDELSQRPVVVVTQGTLANEHLTDLILPTVLALADLDVTVIAVTARADGPDELRELLGNQVPANARLEGYVPFNELLPHAAVMVTNGGYGGVNTALRNGIPLVVAGDSEDKPEVAARVQWTGTGIDLRTGTPDAPAVREAVVAVLADSRYRERARQLSEEYGRYDPFDALATLVDEIAEARRS
ncbi:glycosyltransferase [Roseateles amylovorans]|uniref:Glycosyltransferase n=1 Tax=Roseateles amylovorans TaxID=2978473 RepID=A0ABY6AZM8_9BURK|nr:glycosyltransferase [Roseateles amylovorans]UXH76535.1 glycosyltransferase [Roseateles amylovorans]